MGSGVAGIVAAHILQRGHDVTIYEKNDYIGGHTHTITVEKPDGEVLPVDTGFIVLNDRTYPLFSRFLDQLDVKVRASEMTFSFQSHSSGLEYAGSNLNTLFAQRQNIIKPSYWFMLYEIVKFFRDARKYLKETGNKRLTLKEFVSKYGYRSSMPDNYLIPMASAIWSTPPGVVKSFPAEPFLKFFENHGLLSYYGRPQWETVVGGSHAYVKAFLDGFTGVIERSRPVSGIRRTGQGVELTFSGGKTKTYDHVVIASHADEALAVLDDPTEEEKRLLGAWRYQENSVVLHNDDSFLPSNRRAWACWNYHGAPEGENPGLGCLTYHMNALQGLEADDQYLVTLNPAKSIEPSKIIREFKYNHPTYTFASMDTHPELHKLNGVRNTYFCGSYFGYGFHEDAVRSAVAVAHLFGLDL